MTIDFSDHFWGERHLGFSILYQNMKAGSVAVKELLEFIKERVQVEEEHNKQMVKHMNKVTTYSQSSHTFSSIWVMVKNALETIHQAQTRLVQNLQDLSKDVHKYQDELSKNHKNVKEQEHDTYDAVNLIQTTTTCLQKAKETYTLRCVELEKLKRENGTSKDIAKAEGKAKKSREEYKQYVDKYAKVRDDYELKMTKSASKFQEQERLHLERMQNLLASYAKNSHECTSTVTGVYDGLHASILHSYDIEQFFAMFIKDKATGSERLPTILFEEPHIDSLFPPEDSVKDEVTQTESKSVNNNNHKNSNSALLNSIAASHATPTAYNLINMPAPVSKNDLDNLWDAPPVDAPPPPPPGASVVAVSKDIPNNATSSRGKLSLFLPTLKRNKGSTPSEASTSPNPDTQADLGQDAPHAPPALLPPPKSGKPSKRIPSTENGDVAKNKTWFLSKGKKKVKDKKPKKLSGTFKSNEVETNSNPCDETISSASSERTNQEVSIDSEGYIIRPPEHYTAPGDNDSHRKSYTSSSDDDSGDELTKKIQSVRIKPVSALPSASSAFEPTIDELRDVVGQMSLKGPIHKSKTSPGGGTNRRVPIRPALTGDGRAAMYTNSMSKVSREDSVFGNMTMPIQPSLTGSSSRARPRSNTPTNMFSLMTPLGGVRKTSSDSASDLSGSMQSLGDITLGQMPSSPSDNSAIPIAMAITETVHAMFTPNQTNKSRVRVWGSVAVSFPASSLSNLTSGLYPPLNFLMTKAEKVHALIPNKRVLSSDAVSQFQSSAVHRFSFDPVGLANHLKKEQETRPNSQFYNIEVLRYEVRNPIAPLLLVSFWKCDRNQTDLRVDYRLNPDCSLEPALLNLQFITSVNGDVDGVQSKPEADWNSTSNRLVWKMTELSKHGEREGTLKCRLVLKNGPSTPSSSNVSFTAASDACLSGAALEISDQFYRLSLVKRKLLSGKYLVEPESR